MEENRFCDECLQTNTVAIQKIKRFPLCKDEELVGRNLCVLALFLRLKLLKTTNREQKTFTQKLNIDSHFQKKTALMLNFEQTQTKTETQKKKKQNSGDLLIHCKSKITI